MDISKSISLLSASKGYIEEIMFCIWDINDQQAYCIANLILVLPKRTQKIVVAFKSYSESVVSFLTRQSISKEAYELILIPDRAIEFSVWIQDSFMVGKRENQTVFLQNKNKPFLPCINDLIVTKGKFLKNINYKLDGGDCLVGEKFILIGAQTIYDNLQAQFGDNLYLSRDESYRIMHGIEINHIKDLPVFHPFIDFLFEVAGDKEIIIIGSLYYNEKIDQKRSGILIENRDPNNRALNNIEYHLDVILTLTGCETSKGYEKVLVAQYVDFVTEEPLVDLPENKSLDLESEQLVNKGFKVYRNKIPVLGNKNEIKLAFNNCIVEHTPTSKTVWIPTFKEDMEKRFFRLNEAIWTELGFTVKELVDCSGLFKSRHGAARCMSKIIKRKITLNMSGKFKFMKTPTSYNYGVGEYTINSTDNLVHLSFKEEKYGLNLEKPDVINWEISRLNTMNTNIELKSTNFNFNCGAVNMYRSHDENVGASEEVLGTFLYNEFFFGIVDLEANNSGVIVEQNEEGITLHSKSTSEDFDGINFSVKETAHPMSSLLEPKLMNLSIESPVVFQIEDTATVNFVAKKTDLTLLASLSLEAPVFNFQIHNLEVRTSDTDFSEGETIVSVGPFLEAIIGAEDYRNLTGGYGVPLRVGNVYELIQVSSKAVCLNVWG